MFNKNLEKLDEENIFAKVTEKINVYKQNNPDKEIISLGVGDVSKPIIKPIIKAMHKAVDDLSSLKSFKGYGAYYGYDFLKEKILENEYKSFNFSLDEIYISNGSKTDTTSILELFDINSKICITDSMYPIYRDGANCLNRNVEILKNSEENKFITPIPDKKYDLIYLCSPNNPIGIAYNYDELKLWVDYALKNKSIILYDNVYEAFISSPNTPHSIYEIPGAKKVAIEFRSFSKKASFTGVRCSYFIIPNDINQKINYLWKKRTINRFNGSDYIAQKGAEAVYLKESQKLINENIAEYKKNANLLKLSFEKLNFKVFGGIDSPFLWIKTKDNLSSWQMFDIFLKEMNIVIIPGIIFGSSGDKYFRVSALGTTESIIKAIERLNTYYEKKN